jgi:hypothetical protein
MMLMLLFKNKKTQREHDMRFKNTDAQPCHDTLFFF